MFSQIKALSHTIIKKSASQHKSHNQFSFFNIFGQGWSPFSKRQKGEEKEVAERELGGKNREEEERRKKKKEEEEEEKEKERRRRKATTWDRSTLKPNSTPLSLVAMGLRFKEPNERNRL
jgi:hypothetical protein